MNYQKGNYILTEYGELPIKHVVFDQYQVTGKDGRILWANDIKPIELTEEWLIKFGFIYHPSLLFWVKDWGENGVEFIRFDEQYNLFSFQLGNGKYKIVEYVHQLQNLYFSLTGTELTIKQ